MLNREQLKILRVLNRMYRSQSPFDAVYVQNQAHAFNPKTFQKNCADLHEKGYLDSLSFYRLKPLNLELSVKGLHYRAFLLLSALEWILKIVF